MINSYERLIERLNHLAYMADPAISSVQFESCLKLLKASLGLEYLPQFIGVTDEAVCFTWWEDRAYFTVEVDADGGFNLCHIDIDTPASAHGSYSKDVDLKRVLSDRKSQRVCNLNDESWEVSA